MSLVYKIELSRKAREHVHRIKDDKSILKAVNKAIEFMKTNPRHPSLNTHEYEGFLGENGEKVFGSYAKNNTPNAYRILWHYGPGKGVITVIAIIGHL